eukprot:SAG11_NODE_10919_length_796_cov_1.411765_1_plen_186_part_01
MLQKARDLSSWREGKKKQLAEKERSRVEALFNDIDDDGGGTLDREEVGHLLSRLSGGDVADQELSAAMSELDADGDGEISFDEFLEWWQRVRQERAGSTWGLSINVRNRELQEKEDLHELFKLIDTDGSDAIDVEELGQLTNDLGLSLTAVQLEVAMQDIDDDGDAEVSFEEFHAWFNIKKKETHG